ncbi:YicC/YloC family endoribonuclease [Solitalea koreensis]|uniref:TIGR00255 family protein n=1 Tax=Solitalea koreensis TaxID=543615 RepID=A0A521AY54_9SPHI|nr:YicC/YloC family endoribonuclease [Solitalea koreensis]SMO39745.1 TIGR00255 family protein [Solitalea koreensis]
MLKSMTGFGLATKETEKTKITVELKSLNSKFLELMLKIPKAHSDKELLIRGECNKLIERGKVNLTITIEYKPGAERKPVTINNVLLKTYYEQLKQSAAELGESPENLFQLVMQMPEVIKQDEQIADDEEWKAVYSTFEETIKAFNNFRISEGSELEKDLVLRINNIIALQKKIEVEEPKRLPIVRERINKYLEDAVGVENIDKNRLEQELVFYIEKFDITEEKVRLKSHCDYFLNTLKEKDANGKKLGFISQEIGREINTMGSKANDANIQKMVVGMKDELEKIKEQLLNVL